MLILSRLHEAECYQRIWEILQKKAMLYGYYFFFMGTVEIIGRVHMKEEQTPLLWCASCSNLFFMVLNFLPFVSWPWRFFWCWRGLWAVYRFNPRLQKFVINQVNYLSTWINISSDKLKPLFSAVHCTLSHKMVIVLTLIALACSEASVSCLIASIQISVRLK